MALKEDSPPAAELHFEGDSLEVLSGFPDDIKRSLGFSLRQLQIGRIYLSKIENRIYVLHCFEKESRKTNRRDIAIASQRLKLVRQRLQEQKSHEKRSGK
jgi:phage-related protein